MADSAKRVQRFALLEQLQAANVERAGQRYQASLVASEQAVLKLASLENYFSAEVPESRVAVYAVNLIEVSVFKSRLQDAIAAQRTVCDRLRQQCELAHQMVMQAEKRRAGLGKAHARAQQQLAAATQKMEEQGTEDAVMARYCR